ncbi:MAG: hydantoinase/carbamoylase family amidase, partial [Planctomycetales bacterium]|nr:hydantoinase/carbamoylase family amidase [Planctomycetales bacterium]
MVKRNGATHEPGAREALLRRLAQTTMDRADVLATCSDRPNAIERLLATPAMGRAHEQLARWMRDAGMEVRLDGAANLMGRDAVTPRDAVRVAFGSHIDTVIDAGRYDGVLGILLGVAVVEVLRAMPLAPPVAVDVWAFSEEEGVRFALPFIGSRALVGTLDDACLRRRDADGKSLSDALRQFGAAPAQLDQCPASLTGVRAFIEPHIEQGPELERQNMSLGSVQSIAGQSRYQLVFAGQGGHAGTTAMASRTDALTAAAAWIATIDQTACAFPELVATVGRLEVEP